MMEDYHVKSVDVGESSYDKGGNDDGSSCDECEMKEDNPVMSVESLEDHPVRSVK